MRGPWSTAVFGCVLLVGTPMVFVTGLLSYAAYDSGLGGDNDRHRAGVVRQLPVQRADRPVWLYRAVIGVHSLLGVTLLPVVLVKLCSVIPKLFAWPPLSRLRRCWSGCVSYCWPGAQPSS